MSIILNDCEKIINTLDFSKLNNKRVLVTGASGLIGLHMISVLQMLKKHHGYNIDVWCWVYTDTPKEFAPIFDGCVVLKSDLTDIREIDKLKSNLVETLTGFDVIIHAACYGQPQKFTEQKIKTINLNTQVIMNLFGLLNRGGSFLFCSTSEVYSGIDEDNIDESRIGTSTPSHPRACYIEGKRCGEAIVHSFCDLGYRAKIARISLAYGPGTKKNDSRVINNFIQKAIQNNRIDLMDSGSSVRTYGYVSDIVEMLYNILLHGQDVVYNVAGNSRISILELANMIGQKMNCDICVPIEDKSLQGSPKIVNSSIEKYLNEFGMKKFQQIDVGLEKTIEWQRIIYK